MRVLTEQELRLLTPEAASLAYRCLYVYGYPAVLVEHALLEAFMLARIHQCRMGVEVFEQLVENACYNMPLMQADSEGTFGAGWETLPRGYC